MGVPDGHAPLATGAAAPAGDRAAWRWWALLVIPLWIVLVVCASWEPVMRDGWGHRSYLFHRGFSLRSLYDFAHDAYLYQNPRLGQPMTLVAYTDGPYHVIVTPLVELAVLALLTALALGRWPRPTRSGDALAAALVTATLAACAPQIGPMLLYRPFTWNYVFGFALNLWWLVPYRFALRAPRPAAWWRAPASFVLGVAAGLCNEHTGVAFAAMGALATLAAWRRGGLRGWMITGLVGLIAGYALLLTAPAQHIRYQGIAAQAGIVERIVERGVLGNLRLLAIPAGALAPSLVLVAIGLSRRPAERAAAIDRACQAALAIGGLVCTLTLLASPKLGPRLYFASVALVAAGLAGWLIDRLHGRLPEPHAGSVWAERWARRSCAILAIGMLAFVQLRLVAIHRVAGPLGAVRLERVEHAAPGAEVIVPRYPFARGRYFLGDDLLDPAVRASLSRQFNLSSVALEPAQR